MTRRWTKSETSSIYRSIERGATVAEIASIHCRSAASVRSHLNRLEKAKLKVKKSERERRAASKLKIEIVPWPLDMPRFEDDPIEAGRPFNRTLAIKVGAVGRR